VTDLFGQPDAATPLSAEERDDLLQSWVTHRADLNEAESANILRGTAWAQRRLRRMPEELLTDMFVRLLHRHMFGDVWRWAGRYRLTDRNLGINPHRIPQEIPLLLGDVNYWVERNVYPRDEIAIRLHHRLVAIHPFPNGNGRHARMMADLLVERMGEARFTWGGASLADVSELRTHYIRSLRAADNHDIVPLLRFARS